MQALVLECSSRVGAARPADVVAAAECPNLLVLGGKQPAQLRQLSLQHGLLRGGARAAALLLLQLLLQRQHPLLPAPRIRRRADLQL